MTGNRLLRLLVPVVIVMLPACVTAAATGPARGAGPRLVPWPKTLRPGRGSLEITARSRIVAGDRSLAPLAKVLSDEIDLVTGVRLATGSGRARRGDVLLEIDLGKVQPVGFVNVITYYDGGRYCQFTAEVSTDRKAWKTVLDFSKNTAPATPAGHSATFPATDARYPKHRSAT